MSVLSYSVFATGVRHVSGIEIYTPSEIEAVNGTDVKLKCTFSSTQPVTLTTAVVSWSFRGINSKVDESVGINCIFYKIIFLFHY